MSLNNQSRIAELPFLSAEDFCLRLLHPHESQKMLAFRIENRQFHKSWEPLRTGEFFTRQYWSLNLDYALQDFYAGDSVPLVMMDIQQEEVMGVINFTSIIRGTFQACHLGYSLGERHQGKGMMTRAIRLSTAYMFEVKKMHRIMANYMPRNKRSAAVLERAGFVVEGKARSFMKINGVWEDHILTSLINPADPTD